MSKEGGRTRKRSGSDPALRTGALTIRTASGDILDLAEVATHGIVLERKIRLSDPPTVDAAAVEQLTAAQRALRGALPDWEYILETDTDRRVYRLRARPVRRTTDAELIGAYFVGALAGLFSKESSTPRTDASTRSLRGRGD